MSNRARALLVLAVLGALLVPATPARAAFSDVPAGHWASTQITYVAETNTWMQDFGPTEFRPSTKESRNLLASALVKAYAPNEPTDPSITFPDLPPSDPYYRYANVAVKLGWIEPYANGKWAGDDNVKRSLLDRSLVLAMGGLEEALAGLAAIHRTDGIAYTWDSDRGPHMQMAAWLELHYDHPTSADSKELLANSYMNRDEIAYSLWKAKTTPSWKIADAYRFETITLPKTKTQMKADMTQYAINQVGYGYIWGGEWHQKSPSGYCCGSQPKGGFDCSGLMWWVLKANEGGYNSAQFRVYPGWSLPERSSSEMAKATTTQLAYTQLQVADLMFFSSSGGTTWSSVDHVGVYIGKNWMFHTTDSGPAIEWVGDGWWRDHFVYGRVLPVASAASGRSNVGPASGDRSVGPSR